MASIADNKVINEILYKDGSDLQTRIETHRLYSTAGIQWDNWVLSHLPDKQYNKIIDIGCGNGRFIFSLIEHNIGESYTGIDIANSGIEIAQAKSQTMSTDVTFRVGDAQSLDVEDNQFDLAMCNHMLWHLPDIAKGLSEVQRVLKSDGVFIATTNTSDYMWQMYDMHTDLSRDLGFPEEMWSEKYRNTRFSLENGNDILSNRFARIEKFVLKDFFEFRETEHFLRYYSTFLRNQKDLFSSMPGEKWEELFLKVRTVVDKEIYEKGSFKVDKTSGLFICYKN